MGRIARGVGQTRPFRPGGPWDEVVGVAANVLDEGADRPASATVYRRAGVYVGFGGVPSIQRGVTLAIRSDRAASESFLTEVREAIWSVNASVPVAQVRTLEDSLAQSMARTSFTLVMLGIAGSIALALGVVGIYGVICTPCLNERGRSASALRSARRIAMSPGCSCVTRSGSRSSVWSSASPVPWGSHG